MRIVYKRSGAFAYRFTQIMLWLLFIGFSAAAVLTRNIDHYNNHQAFIACACVMLAFALAGEWALRKVVTQLSMDDRHVAVEVMSSIGQTTLTVPRQDTGFGAPGATRPIIRQWRSRRQTVSFVPIYVKGRRWPFFMDVTKDKLAL